MDIFDSTFYIVRILGRLGFVIVIVNFFRIYNVIASPTSKLRDRKFALPFILLLSTSTALLLSELIIRTQTLIILSTLCYDIALFILAWFLNKQADMIEQRKGSDEFKHAVRAMDEFLETLKRS